jgi:D-arabinose 1-dehydrogenase-like Zn-dependent alcohol dehydrogenase
VKDPRFELVSLVDFSIWKTKNLISMSLQGTRVALLAVPGCGQDTCSECSRDLAQLCPHGVHHGIGQDGSQNT